MSDHEEFGRQLIRNALGGQPPAKPEKFTYATICELRDRILQRYNGYPDHCRLEGMRVDLTEVDKSRMAHFEAAVEILNRSGLLDRGRLEQAMPHPYTVSQEVVEDQACGHTFVQQKR